MTPKQLTLYRREWNTARKAGALKEPDRHRLHIETLGCDKSSTQLDNKEFDKLLATFRAISSPADLNSQLHAQNQPRARLLHGIRTAAPEPYLESIMHDRWGHTDLDRLSEQQLQQLLMTLKTRSARSRSASACAPEPINEPF